LLPSLKVKDLARNNVIAQNKIINNSVVKFIKLNDSPNDSVYNETVSAYKNGPSKCFREMLVISPEVVCHRVDGT
jgi:hypothetical protein